MDVGSDLIVQSCSIRVWSVPVDKLATEWGLSGRGLAKACRRLKIPVPSRVPVKSAASAETPTASSRVTAWRSRRHRYPHTAVTFAPHQGCFSYSCPYSLVNRNPPWVS